MERVRELAVLLAVCGLVHFVGLGDVGFYTRGEPREGLVVREMLATGHWLVPARPEGELTRKPPLYYWLTAPVAQALPDTPEFAMRLPSAVLATATAVGTWAITRAVVGPAAALPAALVLVTSFEWSRAATSARVDMALAAPLAAVIAGWMLVLGGRDRRWLVLAAAGASAAALAKGPVGLVLPALAAIVLAIVRRDRRVLHTLGVVPVLGTAALVAGSWYATAFLQQGWAFLDVVLKENVARFVDADESRTGHAHGIFYLPLMGLVGMLPWTPLLPLLGPAVRRSAAHATMLATVWSGVVVVFFSVANAKRSIYLLPLYPAAAMLVARGVSTAPDLARRVTSLYAPLLGLLGVLVLAMATGADPTPWLGTLLRQEDLHGAMAVVRALHARPMLVGGLGAATLVAALLVTHARHAGNLRQVVLVVATVFAVWTAVFQTTIHRSIGRARGVETFLHDVDQRVPAGESLGIVHPVHPPIRFYAPRSLVPIRIRDHAAVRWGLLWEEEVTRWQKSGVALRVVAMSHNRPGHQGRLALVTFAPAQPPLDAGT